jgi:hypothetical protein
MQAVEQVGPGRMRFVIAKRRGRRGEGSGNECFSWAKGWIASQELDARLIGPSWGINARRYYRNLGTSRTDVLLEEACLRLPHHDFTEADYWERARSTLAVQSIAGHREKALPERSLSSLR